MIKRYLYRVYRMVTGIQFWARRRFTRAGFLVLTATLFAGVLGMDTLFSLAYQGLMLLAGLLGVSVGWGWLERGQFTGTRVLPRYGTVGQPLPYRLWIENQSGRVQSELMVLEEAEDPRPGVDQFCGTPEPGEERRNWFDRAFGYYRWRWLMGQNRRATIEPLTLRPMASGERRESPHALMPHRRGWLRLTHLTLAWPDPFGLFRSIHRMACAQSVLILPKRYALPWFSLPGSMCYQPGGLAFALSVGESEEFMGVRNYRWGDPLRHIHWRSWAKAGRPIVKEFQDEFFVRHALVLDTFGSPGDEEAFEEAVSVAASFACTTQDQDSLLDLLFVGPQTVCFTSGRGLAHPEQMLEILAAAALCQDRAFAELERLVLQHAVLVSGCICIFLKWDDARQGLIRQLKVLGIPSVVFLLVPAGEGLQNWEGVSASGAAELHCLELGKVGEQLSKL